MPPIFDRVDDTPTEIPTHLEGASPEAIHKYWMDRERQIRAEGAPPPPPTPRAAPAAPPQGMTPGQAQTLIAGARLLASQAREHWARFLPEVEGIMGQMSPEQQMDSNMWSTVYDKVVGMHMAELTKEAREAALRPPPMESSSPASPAAAPRQLSENELHVVDQLKRAGATAVRLDAAGKKISVPFDAEAYIKAEERRQSNSLPLTYGNY